MSRNEEYTWEPIDPEGKLAARWYTARQREIVARLVAVANELEAIRHDGMRALDCVDIAADPECPDRELHAVARGAWSWLWEETTKARAVVLRVAAGPAAVEREIVAALDDLRRLAPETYRAIGALAVRLAEGNADLLIPAEPGDRLMEQDPMPPPLPIIVEERETVEATGCGGVQ